MPSSDGSMFDLIGILAVLALVVANGFFVAAEFSLVAVRRSRVAELVSARRTNATALQHAVENLDAYLAATQLGITISSLALGLDRRARPGAFDRAAVERRPGIACHHRLSCIAARPHAPAWYHVRPPRGHRRHVWRKAAHLTPRVLPTQAGDVAHGSALGCV